MKTPKLKYYYHALSIEEYAQFETTRQIEVTGSILYDIASMTTTGRTYCVLTGAAVTCDQEYRERTKTWAPVMVLRIPSELVDRGLLRPVANQILMYHYPASLHIEHCGVERIEIEPTDHIQTATIAMV